MPMWLRYLAVAALVGLALQWSPALAQTGGAGDPTETQVAITYSPVVSTTAVEVRVEVAAKALTGVDSLFAFVEPGATLIRVSDTQGQALSFGPLQASGGGAAVGSSVQKAMTQGRTALEIALPATLQPGQTFSYVLQYTLPPLANVGAKAPAPGTITGTVGLFNSTQADFSVYGWGDQLNLKVQLPPGWTAFTRNTGLFGANFQPDKTANSFTTGATGAANNLALAAQIEATATGNPVTSEEVVTVGAPVSLDHKEHQYKVQLNLWDYNQSSGAGLLQQLGALIPVMERLTGRSFPAPPKLVIREVGGPESGGFALNGFNYAPRPAKPFQTGSDYEISLARPGPPDAAQLANGLAHLWAEEGGLAPGWLEEAFCVYLTQRTLKNTNLAFEADTTFSDLLSNWQPNQVGAATPSVLDTWQPLSQLVGLSAEDDQREKQHYQLAMGFLLELDKLSGAGENFLPTLLGRANQYQAYFSPMGSQGLLDWLEEAFNAKADPNFNAQLDRLFGRYVFAQRDAARIQERRSLHDDLADFNRQTLTVINQTLPYPAALSARLQRETALWRFDRARQELDSGKRLYANLEQLFQEANAQNLKLPDRLNPVLQSLAARAGDLKEPISALDADTYGYTEAETLVGHSLAAAGSIKDLRGYLQKYINGGYNLQSPAYQERKNLEQQAVAALGRGRPQEAESLARQALNQGVEVNGRDVINANNFALPGAHDSWRVWLPYLLAVLFGSLAVLTIWQTWRVAQHTRRYRSR